MRTFWLVFLLSCVALSAQAGVILNDGFNYLNDPMTFTSVAAGGTIPIRSSSTLNAVWTVGGSGVDWIGNRYWQSADGDGSIDLSASGAGSISTVLTTVIGQIYTVTFFMAGNPEGNPAVKVLSASLGGDTLPRAFSFDIFEHSSSTPTMGWVPYSFDFHATSEATSLTFTAESLGPYGPAIDGVLVATETPEPATFGLLGLAGIGLGLFRRRR